jgi:hypothetical protein
MDDSPCPLWLYFRFSLSLCVSIQNSTCNSYIEMHQCRQWLRLPSWPPQATCDDVAPTWTVSSFMSSFPTSQHGENTVCNPRTRLRLLFFLLLRLQQLLPASSHRVLRLEVRSQRRFLCRPLGLGQLLQLLAPLLLDFLRGLDVGDLACRLGYHRIEFGYRFTFFFRFHYGGFVLDDALVEGVGMELDVLVNLGRAALD